MLLVSYSIYCMELIIVSRANPNRDSIYAFVGHFALDSTNPMNTPAAGSALIVFSCLAIAAFATTWGPLVWAVVAELYPSRYRAPCMALATATNWFLELVSLRCPPLYARY